MSGVWLHTVGYLVKQAVVQVVTYQVYLVKHTVGYLLKHTVGYLLKHTVGYLVKHTVQVSA